MLSRNLLSDPRVACLFLVTIGVTGLTLNACQAVLGLSDYDVDVTPALSAAPLACRSHADCPGPKGLATATFCTGKGACASLQSEDCMRLAGSERDPHALLIATLFATSGVDSAVELSRQRAAQLAVDEINERGGIAAKDSNDARTLLLVACDAAANAERATSHLTSLGARAVVGLSDSEQLLQTLRTQLLSANLLTLSTALASDSINSLLDADLAWLMSLTVEQRAPVLDVALTALEQHLQGERSEPLKLALLFRYDAAGRAGLSSLRTHELDGMPLGMPDQSAGRVRVDRLPDSTADRQALIATYRGFAPDIVVMLGADDVLAGVMAPLERSYESDASATRPHYLLTEEAKGPALIALVRELPSLLERVHGVGTALPERSRNASEGFHGRYKARFSDDDLGTSPRVAAAYDAVYALAYASAGIEPEHELGGRLAQALHRFAAPEQSPQAYDVGPESLGTGLQRAVSGEPLALLGASGELHWDSYGALGNGVLESWCLEADSGGPRYGNAPWQFEVAAHSFSERPGSCDPWLTPASDDAAIKEPDPTKTDRAMLGNAMTDAMSGNGMTGNGMTNAMTAAMMSPAGAGRGSEPSAAGASGGPANAGAAAPMMAGNAGAAADKPIVVETPRKPSSTLRCGELSCQRDKEECCVAMLRPLMAPVMGDLSCTSRSTQTQPEPDPALATLGAAGSGGGPSCELSAQCVSDADCEQGSVCCAGAQALRCVPGGMCTAELGRRLACKSAQECPAGQQCCLYGDSASMSFANSACAASCGLVDASVRLCLNDAGCADDPTSTSCNPSRLLPVISTCWPKGL